MDSSVYQPLDASEGLDDTGSRRVESHAPTAKLNASVAIVTAPRTHLRRGGRRVGFGASDAGGKIRGAGGAEYGRA